MHSLHWLDILLNAAIALAYFLIPVGLLSIVRRSWGDIPGKFRALGIEFAAFILGCALTHVAHALMPFFGHGVDVFSTVAHIFTAVVSVRTALRMPAIARQVIDFITQSRRKERELAASEARFRAFSDFSPAIKVIKNSNLELVFGNRAFERVFGSIPIGFRDDEWLPDDVAEVTRANDLQVMRTGEPMQVIEMVPTASEKKYWLVHKFAFDQGGDRYLGGVAWDITEQRATEIELRRSNAELEQFAYTASHDLNQPVRSIKGFTDYMESRLQECDCVDEVVADCLSRIKGATERMHRLLNALLTYSRIGRKEVEIQDVDVTHVAQSVLEDVSALIHERNAIVTVGYLPVVRADAAQVGQILSNLITNAIKYTPMDRAPQIRLGAIESSENWNFYVSDRGEGIAPEHQEAIFQVCQRLHGAEIEGTGMGLAVVKKAVEFYGGKVWLRSQVGAGSTFWFSLPKS